MARLSLSRLSRLSRRRSSKKRDSATTGFDQRREEHLRKHAVVTLQEMEENWEAARGSMSPVLEDWVESATSEPVKCARAALAELICKLHHEVDEGQLFITEDLHLTERSTPSGYDKSIFMFLDALPDGLRVSGKLVVQNCYSLVELPKNLEVGGDFLIQLCFQLERLPAELVVEGALIVKHCSKLLDIGQNLVVKENLQLIDLPLLEQLPDEAKFEGSIEIKHCPSLVRFEPHTLVINGNLELLNIPKLAALPDNLTVEGDFKVSCLPIRSFPKGLTVKGFYLSATYCDSLELFPPDFYFDGCVDLRYCSSLYMVPDGLTILSDLILAGCSSLGNVPEDMDVAHDFNLSACDALTEFPTNIRVGGRLTMENCESIVSFGPLEEALDNMEANQADDRTETQNSFMVGMDFSLKRCTSLKALPQNLVVEGNLSLKGCSALTGLPSGLFVRGHLQLEDCSRLSSIPSEILAWPEPRHDIYIGGTNLSQETLDWLRSADTRNVRFHVNLQQRSSQLVRSEHFQSLEEVLVLWMSELETISSRVKMTDLPPSVQQTALRFFSKLRGAKEFGITETRSVLAKRVLRAWELLLDPECQEEVVQRMEDSLDACNDKPIWALNQLTLVDLVFKARGNREALRELGLRVMRLMIVHEHVERKIQSLSWVDDVCVYLRFEIELRESLELPVEATDMIFKSYITVEDEELQAAEKAALSISDDEFEAWLETWPEWLRQDRYEVAQSLHWEDLPMVKSNLVVPNTDLSGFLMNDPVLLRKQVWSLHDVLVHWLRTGLDLMNSPLSEKHILNLQRVAVPKRRSLRRSLRRLLHSVKSL